MGITRRETMAVTAGLATALLSSSGSHAKEKKSALKEIRALDYTIIFARDMLKMKAFYSNVMQFDIIKALGTDWIEFRVGSNILALTPSPAGGLIDEKIPAAGGPSLQLAFRVSPQAVNDCAEQLKQDGVKIVSGPTDQKWGHRTLFFKDPDQNILEIYADI